MRISDWSSDVCSSDLLDIHFGNTIVPEITIDQCRDYADKRRAGKIGGVDEDGKRRGYRKADDGTIRRALGGILVPAISHAVKSKRLKERTEERRVGKEGVRTGRSRWSPIHKNKKKKIPSLIKQITPKLK